MMKRTTIFNTSKIDKKINCKLEKDIAPVATLCRPQPKTQ